MKELAILVMFIFAITILKGQNIEIGQDADEIISIIEATTNEHNRVQHENKASTYWNWDVIFKGDQITDVMQCYSNEFIYGLGDIRYYCKHYMISDNRLAYISTRFTGIDSAQVNKYFLDNYGGYKIGQFYFSSDYNYYSKISASRTGHAVVDWRRAEWSDLSPEMQDTISNRLSEHRGVKLLNAGVEAAQKQKELEIKSRTYDLQIHDSARYQLFIKDLRQSLIGGLKEYSKFPEWSRVENEKNKCFIFKNSYSALYRIYDQSNSGSDSRFLLLPDDGVFDVQNHFKLVRGSDSTCEFLGYYSPSLPSIKMEGFNVMTDALVNDIDVFYSKGITNIIVKKGEITYREYIPPPEIEDLISYELRNLQDGLYEIKYAGGNVMGSTFMNTEPKKISTFVGKILGFTGVIIFLSILLIANSN